MKIEIPKLNRQMLDCVRFVIRAASKEMTRYAINLILVEKDRFIATDGHRLHIADIPHNYEPGLYEIMQCNLSRAILLKSDDEINFPKYEDIVPKHKSHFETKSYSLTVPAAVAIAFGLAQKGVMVRPDFLKDAVDTANDSTVYYGANDRPVLIVCGAKRAVIMSITPPTLEYITDAAESEG